MLKKSGKFLIALPMVLLMAACSRQTAQDKALSVEEPHHDNAPVGMDVATLTVQSAMFKDGESIPKKFTCDGENIHPPLLLGDVPESAESVAIIVDDPDAPSGTFDHWVLWNIPPDLKTIDAAGEPPESVVFGNNSKGEQKYTGPCPPNGEHRYYFKVYALNKKLDLPAGSSKDDLEAAMGNNIVARGELMGRYKRGEQKP